MARVFPPTSLFIAALLLAGSLGDIHPPLARLLAWTLMAFYTAGLARRSPVAAEVTRRATALALAGGAFVVSRGDGGTAALAVPAWLLGLVTVARRRRNA